MKQKKQHYSNADYLRRVEAVRDLKNEKQKEWNLKKLNGESIKKDVEIYKEDKLKSMYSNSGSLDKKQFSQVILTKDLRRFV